ncbi:MAG TPA: energy transducer TonB [candidate division Zixibacteria bacterium]|nr:energy transducer TonB [candidate division Zixibacteria bacterium]
MRYRDPKADLPSQWGTNLKRGIIISLAGLLLIALTFISIEIGTIEGPEYQQIIQIEEIEETRQQIQKEEPPKPKIAEVIATEDEDIPDTVTIAETDLVTDSFIPPPPMEDEIVDFFALEAPPKPVKEVRPRYPQLAERAQVEGVVLVQVVIGLDGKVEHAEVIQARPEGFFEEAALDAARQWEFTPAKQRDKPVRVRYQIPLRFELR